MTSDGDHLDPAGAGPGPDFVIFAAPRSGTTWLKAMLNLHPQIHCTELRLFGSAEMVSYDRPEQPEMPNIRLTLDKYAVKLAQHMTPLQSGMDRQKMQLALSRALLASLFRVLRQELGSKILVDKVTPYQGTERKTFETYRQWFPKARFVFLVRDGRDVAVSGMFNWCKRRMQIEQTPFERARQKLIEGDLSGPPLPSAFRPGELEGWAENWAGVAAVQAAHTAPTIRYEDMIGRADETLSSLLSDLGVSAEPEVVARCVSGAAFKVMSGGRCRGEALPGASARSGVVGDWRHTMTRRDGEVFQSIAGGQLARLGYAGSAAWIGQLAETFDAYGTNPAGQNKDI
ncbi:MAG: sulfotransferase domain-containing protein [Pseudomonadota bacterium]